MNEWFAAIDHILVNAAVFCGFFVCATVHHCIAHRRRPTAAESFWHGVGAGILSPAVLDSSRDFLVHLVVYSGYIIPQH